MDPIKYARTSADDWLNILQYFLTTIYDAHISDGMARCRQQNCLRYEILQNT